MPLFRKKSQSQADRLLDWRSGALSRGATTLEGLGPLLEELGLTATQERRGWHTEIGDGGRLFISTVADGTTLSAWTPLEDSHDAGQLAELLRRNLDSVLAWAALGDDGEGGHDLGARIAIPLDGFERASVLLGLESIAGAAGDQALAARAREARDPARGELAEQAGDERGRAAVQGALDALDLSAETDAERAGVWRVAVERGTVEAVLRDTGESLMLLYELEYTGGDADVATLRWLLQASEWNSSRLGLASLPGGPGLFAACVVPAHALEPQGLAWGLAAVLALRDDYDRLAQ